MTYNIYLTGFMKTVLNIPIPITLISPWFHPTFTPLPSHVNRQKIEKGGQCKGNKRVKKEKKGWPSFYFYIVIFGESLAKKPLRARFPFLSTVFINPDIYFISFVFLIPLVCRLRCNWKGFIFQSGMYRSVSKLLVRHTAGLIQDN